MYVQYTMYTHTYMCLYIMCVYIHINCINNVSFSSYRFLHCESERSLLWVTSKEQAVSEHSRHLLNLMAVDSSGGGGGGGFKHKDLAFWKIPDACALTSCETKHRKGHSIYSRPAVTLGAMKSIQSCYSLKKHFLIKIKPTGCFKIVSQCFRFYFNNFYLLDKSVFEIVNSFKVSTKAKG